MANTITTTVLNDGPRNLNLLVNIVGDGSGEETGTVLVDRSAYVPATALKLSLRKVKGFLSGFNARLLWNADADLVIAQMPDASDFCFDWCAVGGIASPKAGAGYNGDLLITTSGLGNGDRGTFTLFMTKN